MDDLRQAAYVIQGTKTALDGAWAPAIMLCDTTGTPVAPTLELLQHLASICKTINPEATEKVGMVVLDPTTGVAADLDALIRKEKS